jgi:hypothetical protein
MFRRRQINAGPGGRIVRFGLGVADAARWHSGRLFERLARTVGRLAWPFERLAWTVERRAVWPLRELAAGRGPSARVAGAGALAAVAAAAVLAGVLLSEGNGGETVELAASPPRVALASPAHPASGGTGAPALHGVPPSFGVSGGAAVAKEPAGEAPEAKGGASGSGAGASGAAGEGGEAATEEAATATASSTAPAPAGPEAMRVARRFADAFVFYEIGKRPTRAKAVFGETASPQLAEALSERPPRLPRGVQVPRAKVVNLVPGPRRGGAYTVSVSLLRVGVTSELRLSLQHSKAGGWRVADVLG